MEGNLAISKESNGPLSFNPAIQSLGIYPEDTCTTV